jgi:hypothetical protein
MHPKKRKKAKGHRKVVATRDLQKGRVLCHFTGIFITYEETKKRGSEESFALQVGEDLYCFLDSPFRYFNHSCDPNCGLTPDLELILLRDVKEGEELNYDYSTTMLERDWQMKCRCGKPNCRKIIQDFDLLPKALQLHYLRLNIVQDFIVKSLKL